MDYRLRKRTKTILQREMIIIQRTFLINLMYVSFVIDLSMFLRWSIVWSDDCG